MKIGPARKNSLIVCMAVADILLVRSYLNLDILQRLDVAHNASDGLRIGAIVDDLNFNGGLPRY